MASTTEKLNFLTAFNFVQSLSHVPFFATPWPAAHQAPLSFTISLSLLKSMSTESVMSSNHLIICHPLLPLPSIFLSIRVFSNHGGMSEYVCSKLFIVPGCWERLTAGRQGGSRGWNDWKASLTQWTGVWAKEFEIVMDRDVWHATVHGVKESGKTEWLSNNN